MPVPNDSDLGPGAVLLFVHDGSTVVETRSYGTPVRARAKGLVVDERISRFIFAHLIGQNGRLDDVQGPLIRRSFYTIGLRLDESLRWIAKSWYHTIVRVSTTPSSQSHHVIRVVQLVHGR